MQYSLHLFFKKNKWINISFIQYSADACTRILHREVPFSLPIGVDQYPERSVIEDIFAHHPDNRRGDIVPGHCFAVVLEVARRKAYSEPGPPLVGAHTLAEVCGEQFLRQRQLSFLHHSPPSNLTTFSPYSGSVTGSGSSMTSGLAFLRSVFS